MTELCIVVITGPDPEWLADFARRLVNDKLSASGHVIQNIRAVYRWRDQAYDTAEGHLTLHTRAEHVPAIISRTEREHPYEVPCVIATPITQASPAYAAWIIEQTTAN